jgi:DNA-binding transcriptional LysR family regulator
MHMSLSSLQLDAFHALSRSKSFSEAAKRLHITQSAFSQRILNLEAEIAATLFVRDPVGVRLTERGEALLQYVKLKERLEADFLGQKTAGIVRVAGFSTFVRPILLPAIAKFAQKNQAEFHVQTKEIHELAGVLRSGSADFVFSTSPIEGQYLENTLLGYEENVLVTKKGARADLFFDHDEFDTTTAEFWKLQDKAPKYKRAYLDEIYAILDAVEAGMGCAVVPLHMVPKSLTIVKNLKPLRVPIYLNFYKQEFPTRLEKATLELFKSLL